MLLFLEKSWPGRIQLCTTGCLKEGIMGQKQGDRDGRGASAVYCSYLLLRVQLLYRSVLLTFSSNRSREGSSVPRVSQHPQSVTKHSLSHIHKHASTHARCQHIFAPNVQCSWVLAHFCRWTEYYSITDLLLLTFPPVTSAVWHLWLLLKCLGDHGMDCRDIWWRHLCYRRRWIILTVLVV